MLYDYLVSYPTEPFATLMMNCSILRIESSLEPEQDKMTNERPT